MSHKKVIMQLDTILCFVIKNKKVSTNSKKIESVNLLQLYDVTLWRKLSFLSDKTVKVEKKFMGTEKIRQAGKSNEKVSGKRV